MSSLNNLTVSEQDYDDSQTLTSLSKTNEQADIYVLNQAPKASAATLTNCSAQSTSLQTVTCTTTITSTVSTQNTTNTTNVRTISNSKILSQDTTDTTSLISLYSLERDLLNKWSNKEHEGSIKSHQRRCISDQSFQTTSFPTVEFSTSSADINNTNNISLSVTSSETTQSLNTLKCLGTSFLDTADEMLMQILISQAVIDSKDFEILSLEEVQELKKDHSLLTTRIAVLTSKLSLESKIQKAASSLLGLHTSNKISSVQVTEHLAAANSKIYQITAELLKLTHQAGEVQRKLLQHMAGVLNIGIRKLEEKSSQPLTFSPQSLQQSVESNTRIDNLFNKLFKKVSNLENSLQNVYRTLEEERMAMKRKDKEIEEWKAKVYGAAE